MGAGSHTALALVLCAFGASAQAQEAATSDDAPAESTQSGIEDIVVTAQRRSERVSDIGMSITAVSGDELAEGGIRSLDDFARIDPSFSFGASQSGTPTYTIRGVGYYDFALSAPPTVSVYVDEVPLAYSALTRGVILDLERVEILKGPQGTLYGQNSTGGAINFIAARPTETLEAGLEASFGRFSQVNVNGFISGPVSDTLRARLAFTTDQGGNWQRSHTRDESHGEKRFVAGRLLLDWTPTSDLTVRFNLNAWRDRSDTQVGQLSGFPRPTALTDPANNVPPPVQDAILDYPLAPRNARAADWGPYDPRAEEDFYQGSVRIDYDVSNAVSLTSITAHSEYERGSIFDIDGMALSNNTTILDDDSRSFFQEARLAGLAVDTRLNWVFGASYASDLTTENQFVDLTDSAPAYSFVSAGGPPWRIIRNVNRSDVETFAVFGNLSFAITDALTANAGARYTNSQTRFEGCTYDTGDGLWAAGNNALQFVLKNFVLPDPAPFVPVLPGGCATFDETFTPALVLDELDEDNISWRAGLDWRPVQDVLVYATVSRGYKAGAFPTSAFLSAVAASPVVQESVLAYELGFKTFWLDRRLQLNGAVFHYDYTNKQINGVVPEPIVFGALFGLINVPKSEVDGFELSAVVRPLQGLSLRGDVTYIDTRVIGDFVNVNRLGSSTNFRGEPFPYTPKWSFLAGASYEWAALAGIMAYAGADFSYRSSTQNGFGGLPFEFIPSYELLDLRVGVRADDERWFAEIWGRNVTNSYYWHDATYVVDTSYRRTGMPVTYGIRAGLRFH